MKRKNAVTEILDELTIFYIQDITGIIVACVDGMFIAFVHSSTDKGISDEIKRQGGIVVDWQEPVLEEDVRRVITDVQKRWLV